VELELRAGDVQVLYMLGTKEIENGGSQLTVISLFLFQLFYSLWFC